MPTRGHIDLVSQRHVIFKGDGRDAEQLAPVADPAVIPDPQPPGEVDVHPRADDYASADPGPEPAQQETFERTGPRQRGDEEKALGQDPQCLDEPRPAAVKRTSVEQVEPDLRHTPCDYRLPLDLLNTRVILMAITYRGQEGGAFSCKSNRFKHRGHREIPTKDLFGRWAFCLSLCSL